MLNLQRIYTFVCRGLGWMFYPIRHNAVFFFFMWCLGALCIILEADPNQKYVREPNPFLELTFDLYFVCALLLIVPHKARRWVRSTLAVMLYVISAIDVWCLDNFQTRISPTMLLLIGETNGREAGEFLRSYLSFNQLLSGVGWILLLAMVHIIVAVNHHRLRSWIKYSTLTIQNFFGLRLAVTPMLQALAGLLFIPLLINGCNSSWENKKLIYRIFKSKTIGNVEKQLVRKNATDIMYLPAYRLSFSMKSNYLIGKQLSELLEAEQKAKVDSCVFTSSNIVLIIGESYNKHHASLFGYDKETTPRQHKMARTGQLITFNDAISPWNLTSFVFKLMFTTYVVNDDDDSDWCNEPLFPSLFRKAGYRVDFLTNQFIPRAREAVYDFSGGFFLNDEDLSRSMFDHRNRRLHDYDEQLLSDYDSLAAIRNNDTVPRLTIFHLMGQHVDYHKRFPKNRTFFRIEDYNRPDLKPKQLKTLVHYDNAVRYNDSIVEQIVKRYENKDAIIIYLADHGEEVYDGINNKHGRVHSENIGPRLAHEEYEIPMWVYCTKKYIRHHHHIFRQIQQCHKRPFMSDALSHMLLYLAGIHTPHYKETLNILSDNYNEQRPRMMKKRVDYNRLNMTKYRNNEKQQ